MMFADVRTSMNEMYRDTRGAEWVEVKLAG
ncbi:hypothetical protein LMG27177_01735 [Paraburkholderia fynbosensis]|uniref:Uncharacterized protein n=1 Tax=Paraburkholderia fynbosensis TaxID=1200993 RepID=A0A6J5FUG4_9BURK|nr:hypothetical protein LMG27177_01735 [Paraburkholderia fynbosensis]